MVSLDELKKENARLKAERENRGLRRRLESENRVLSGKASTRERLTAVFKRSAATTYPAVKSAAVAAGKGAKSYAEYRMGEPERIKTKPKYIQGRKQTYYKKIGPRKYKKVNIYRRENEEREETKRKPRRHSTFGKSYFGGGSDILGTSPGIHGQSSDLFRRTI